MKKLLIVIVAIAFLTEAGLCAGPMVNVEKKGSYVYWFTYKDTLGQDQTTLPMRFKGTGADLDASALGVKFSKAKLFVADKRTGNMAIVDYSAPKDPKAAKPIDLKADDFQYVRGVRLKIVSEDGAPLESALVDITDGQGTPMRAVVTPADGGVASFANVATGEISVKVKANGLKRTVDSDIELPQMRKSPGFERDIKVTGDVDTLTIAAPAGGLGAGKETQKKKPSGAARALQTIAGLVFVIVIIAIVYGILKSRQMTTEEVLKKLGVQLPSDQGAQTGAEAPAGPAVDPNVCQFCGQRKDAAGNCACTITPGAAPAGPTSPGTGGPRLVGMQGTYLGRIFDIGSGQTSIGREEGNEVALGEDSTVSRRHASITVTNGEYWIRDEGSSNGTLVNGARVTEQRLVPGDEVQIGATRFRFEV